MRKIFSSGGCESLTAAWPQRGMKTITSSGIV
jgi:hypothetical protein